MKKSLKILITSFFVICAVIMSSFEGVFADTYSYSMPEFVTDSFNTTIKVNKDYTFDVREEINVDFKSMSHGIFRVIPISYGRYELKNIKVEGGHLKVESTEKGDKIIKSLKIGSKHVTFTGKHKYVISYTMVGINRGKESDVLRLNLLPTNWQSRIKEANVKVIMPTNFDFNVSDIYYGSDGSDAKLIDLNSDLYSLRKDKNSLSITIHDLDANEGASLITKLPSNYWVGSKSYRTSLDILTFGVLGLFILALLVKIYFRTRFRLICPISFYPPDDLDPLAMGYLLYAGLSLDDQLVTTIYFASKGYLTIEECEDEYGDKYFTITKVKDIDGSEPDYMKRLFKTFFSRGDVLDFRTFDRDFVRELKRVSIMVDAEFSGNKAIFKGKSSIFSLIFSLGAIALGCLIIKLYSKMNISELYSFLSLGYIFIGVVTWLYMGDLSYKRYFEALEYKILTILWAVIVLIFGSMSFFDHGFIIPSIAYIGLFIIATSIKSRTKFSIEMIGKIMGFRRFLEKVEKPRLKVLVNENPSYFYDILPYAYILNVSSEWVDKFKDIEIESPSWYNGSEVFSVAVFEDSYFSSIGDLMDTPAFSGGSYSGGSGDYSGGGFGGGGGGSW